TSLGKEGLVVEELTVPEKSFLVERTLAESQLKPKYGITVIGVKPVGGRMIISPGPEVRLQPGDIVVIIGSVTGLEQLSRDLNGHR
ncbi:MAG: potassium channel protein, partial [Candidatus Zixiibacteriota bacterium]